MQCPCGKTHVAPGAVECWLCHRDLRGPAAGDPSLAPPSGPPTNPVQPIGPPTGPPGGASAWPPSPAGWRPPAPPRRRSHLGLVVGLSLLSAVVLAGLGFVAFKVVSGVRETAAGDDAVERYVAGKGGVEYESKTCGFKATYPTEPTFSSETMHPSGFQVTIQEFESPPRSTTAKFTGVCMWVTGQALPESTMSDLLLSNIEGGSIDVYGTEAGEVDGVPTTEARLVGDGKTGRLTMVTEGDRFFILVAESTEPDVPGWDRFRGSLELTR